RYVDHRSRHSFPTRRSSDLQYLVSASADRETWVEVLRAEGSPINDGNRAKHVLDVADLLGRTGSDGTLYLRFADSTPADGWGGKDRKSTRLNSSHVKISYAV